ncbi:MAG: GAF domain-containing sensor histidine kinase [Chloroflexota bacterium]
MAETGVALPPLHELLEALDSWRVEPSAARVDALHGALGRLLVAYGVRGCQVALDAPPLPELTVGAGTLLRPTSPPESRDGVTVRALQLGDQPDRTASLWIDGPAEGAKLMAEALELALNAVWSRQEARLQGLQLAALDAAVRGIAGVQSVDRVLQLIVDRVRELAAARYAALGIVDAFGTIEEFITSGVTPEQRAKIGALPRGHGLLGLIIREDRSFLIDDIAADPRRYEFPPHHPEMHSFLGVPVLSKGRSIGNLYLTNKLTARMFSEADLRLVEMFALHAGIAIENARLHEEVQRLAVVEERQRISQDLHDSIIQSLYAISLSLEDLPEVIAEDPTEAAARADRAIDSIHGTIRDIRKFIFGLQPELLDADLATGVESLAAEFRANTLIDLEVTIGALPTLPAEHAAHVLAITHEGLSNIARHSAATRAWLELTAIDGMLRLVIGDNGRGFDTAAPRNGQQRGQANLRSRAKSAGGSLLLASKPGEGTRLEAGISLEENA